MLKGLFGANRQGRRDDAELGKGVWRRAHDRFRRGLDRFHQMLEGLEADAMALVQDATAPVQGATASAQETRNARDNYARLVPVANSLADLLPEVRRIAARAQSLAPSEGMDIPFGAGGYLNDVHRELSRAGNALATAAESVAMLRLGAGDMAAVERRSGTVHQHVNRARELLEKNHAVGK
ncbi:hypothetical protein AOC05_18430 [Arthrobacter alpinus]|uniref:Uncharacterized protein n=1 Tax=Arthrobacter alpinus TaxID=656366 RepID=A0A0M4RRF7_9MICC|nr:hypothetical protein [Arthrobacter alpinus]ALE93833.1 hypothetical protein AOC05_18430 [Arthrobacter alpinus]